MPVSLFKLALSVALNTERSVTEPGSHRSDETEQKHAQ